MTDIKKAEWRDIAPSCSLEDFASKNNLSLRSLSVGRGVIVLPANQALGQTSDHHLFSAHSKEVLVILQESGLQAHLYEDDRERRELVLKSANLVLPILYAIGGAACSVMLGVVANWISSKLLRDQQSEPPSIKAEYAELTPDGTVRWRRIKGPAAEVKNMLLEESKALADEAATAAKRPLPVGTNSDSHSPWDNNQKNRRKRASRKRRT